MIIAFCGIDGCGKTTQIQLTKDHLKGFRTYVTKQPTSFYRQYDRFKLLAEEKIAKKNIFLKELELIAAADKLRHYQTELEQINSSAIILSDRYVFSTYAYFYARGEKDIEWLKSINRHIPLPDITFYFDIDPELAMSRVYSRDRNSMTAEEKNLTVMKTAREAFINEIWGAGKDYYVIDGNQEKEIVNLQVMEILRRRLENEG